MEKEINRMQQKTLLSILELYVMQGIIKFRTLYLSGFKKVIIT